MLEFVLPVGLVIANVCGAGMVLAQVLRLRREQAAGGVSPTWVGVGLALNSWWLAYGSAHGLWGLIPVSAGSLAFYVVMGVQLRRLTMSASDRPIAVGFAVTWAVPAAFFVVDGWAGAGLAVGLAYAVQFAPAVIDAMRATDVRGISAATWWMALGEASIWILYGLHVGDTALLVGGTGGSLMAAAILLRLAAGRRLLRAQPATLLTS